MNKHIELVKKWLNDPDSVTREELNSNADAASGAAYATFAAWAARDAAYAARADNALFPEDAAYWVKKYEEMTDE